MKRGRKLADELSRDIGRRLTCSSPAGVHTATVVGVVHNHGGYYHYVVVWDGNATPSHTGVLVNPRAAAWGYGSMTWLEDQ